MTNSKTLVIAAALAVSLFIASSATGFWVLGMKANISPLGKLFVTGMYVSALWFLISSWVWSFRSMLRGFSWRILFTPSPADPDARAAKHWSWHVVCAWLVLAGCLAGLILTEFVLAAAK